MKIAINNRQKVLKINRPGLSALTSFLMTRASRLKPDRNWQEISLVLTDNDLISSLNEEFMGRRRVTDVLSFCLPPMPGGPALFSGEVFVNAEIAMERKPEAAPRELALYVAHGCDHLMDEDDSDEVSRKRMRNRELRWLREADTMDLLQQVAEPSAKASRNK